MPRQAVAFSSNEQRSKPLDAARLVNLFPEQPPLGARAPSLTPNAVSTPIKSVLYGTPGLKLSQTLGAGSARAARPALGYFWVLYSSTLYRIDSSGTTVACGGDSISAAGTAMMSDNGKQLAVLSNGLTYVVGSTNATGSFTVTSGTNNAGTNKIDSIKINSVTITSGALDWADSNEAFAGAIAADINSYASTPEYTAETNGATVIIKASTSGVGPNGFGVEINVAGDVTVSPPSTEMSGGAASSTVVQQVTSTNYPTAGVSSIDYIDGFTVFTTNDDTRQWFISQLYDTTSIDALDFATAESTPGPLLRVLVCNREIWLFSSTGISVWTNTGGSPFPFSRIPGATMEKGCAAALSPATLDSTVFWLGADLIVYKAVGYTPQRISTHGLEEILRAASTVSDAYGMTYTQGGHLFYILTLPTLDRTFCYDTATQGWHERQSGTDQINGAWHVKWLAAAFGKIWAGLNSGRLCEVDLDTYTEAGEAIRRAAVTPPFYPDGKRAAMTLAELECELGVGLANGQGDDPQVMLRWSDDGGRNWSNGRTTPIGKLGKGRDRAIFRRLGLFRQRQLEFSISDPVKVAIYGMRTEFIPAAS